MSEGDPKAMSMLERLSARWQEGYGSSGAGTTSTTMGAVVEASSSPIRTEGCGLMQDTRVLHPKCTLPPAGRLPPLARGQPVGLKHDNEPVHTSSSQHEDLTAMFVGSIPINPNPRDGVENVDDIARGFENSSRKTLKFIPLESQNGEIIIKPTLSMARKGATRWQSTAVDYFLGRKPYFHHLNEFVRSVWPALQEVVASSQGLYFFRFKSVGAMEEVIEGGPWLFQGQPIVLQKWEPGMLMMRKQHKAVPVWIRLRNLPLEYWTEEGLSVVASGIGKPLYQDAITKQCSRVDYARVCVLEDFDANLPKHLVLLLPSEQGRGGTCKVLVEYEWLPAKCTTCSSLGHKDDHCPSRKKATQPVVQVYIPKASAPRNTEWKTVGHSGQKLSAEDSIPLNDVEPKPASIKGKEIVVYNPFDALDVEDDNDIDDILHMRGPNSSPLIGQS